MQALERQAAISIIQTLEISVSLTQNNDTVV